MIQSNKTFDVKIPIFRKSPENKIIFYILVINKYSGAVNTLRKRYSDLRDFHDKLDKKIKEYRLDIYLPIFPSRSLINKTNNDN